PELGGELPDQAAGIDLGLARKVDRDPVAVLDLAAKHLDRELEAAGDSLGAEEDVALLRAGVVTLAEVVGVRTPEHPPEVLAAGDLAPGRARDRAPSRTALGLDDDLLAARVGVPAAVVEVDLAGRLELDPDHVGDRGQVEPAGG